MRRPISRFLVEFLEESCHLLQMYWLQRLRHSLKAWLCPLSLLLGCLCPREAFGNICRHFLFRHRGGSCYWQLVSWSQGCRSTSCNTQDSPHQSVMAFGSTHFGGQETGIQSLVAFSTCSSLLSLPSCHSLAHLCNCYCWIVYFSFNFPQFLLYLFWCSVFRHI